jgi:WD40 repeat protein
VHLVPLAEPAKARRLGTHEDLFGVALSPDGRWAASAGGGDTVCVWDVARGTLVRRLAHRQEYGGVVFSPDGRRLVTGVQSDFRFWEVGSWKRQARLPRDPRSLFSFVAFTRDGRLLALAHDRNRIHLHNAVTLRHLATLEVPGQANLTGLSLSPDGTRLAAATEHNLIALWDLRKLRQELANLDLDFPMTAYPARERRARPPEALLVKVLHAAQSAR